ncbi:uncharacterized protein [Vulpes vulpes]|uniref:Uncharacterized protein isoform X7 n=1 Tax=Vulpes vulpes TaxID=9627 RepID=A0ABM4XQ21_VULVU
MAERSQTAPEAGYDMGNDDAIGGNVSKYLVLPSGYCGQPKKGHLIFDACFESGNLGRVDQVSEFEYDLFIRPDTCNPRFRVWFNFTVENVKESQRVIFNIVNFSKTKSLYRDGMAPMVKSTSRPKWQRLPPKNVYYYRCPDHRKNYVMSFAFCFDREEDIYQFAYCYPYTYTRFQHYLDGLQKRNMDYFFREQLGQSVQQRQLDLLTITSPGIRNRASIPETQALQGIQECCSRTLASRAYPRVSPCLSTRMKYWRAGGMQISMYRHSSPKSESLPGARAGAGNGARAIGGAQARSRWAAAAALQGSRPLAPSAWDAAAASRTPSALSHLVVCLGAAKPLRAVLSVIPGTDPTALGAPGSPRGRRPRHPCSPAPGTPAAPPPAPLQPRREPPRHPSAGGSWSARGGGGGRDCRRRGGGGAGGASGRVAGGEGDPQGADRGHEVLGSLAAPLPAWGSAGAAPRPPPRAPPPRPCSPPAAPATPLGGPRSGCDCSGLTSRVAGTPPRPAPRAPRPGQSSRLAERRAREQ